MASDESIETEAFSLIVMEDVSDRFQQSCSMDRSRAMALMEALATLHSHYWGEVDHRERGSFWTMERRKPKKGGRLLLTTKLKCPTQQLALLYNLNK